MDFMCRKCGGTGFYLKQNGFQVGMYCDNCGTWGKWVGKKELPILKQKGHAVLPQNATVSLRANVSLGLEQVDKIKDIENVSLDNKPFGNMGVEMSQDDSKVQKDIELEVEKRVKERLKMLGKEEIKGEEIKKEKIESEEYCPVCEGNPLVPEGQSAVEVTIYSGVMTVTDPEGLNILGLYKLKRCPFCGKMF